MRLERTLFIYLHPFTKTHIHLNDITYHIDQQKEPREGHSHRPSSEMVPSTYRRLSRQSLPQGSAYKGSQVSRCPPWEPGTCVKMAIRAPASLSPPPQGPGSLWALNATPQPASTTPTACTRRRRNKRRKRRDLS